MLDSLIESLLGALPSAVSAVVSAAAAGAAALVGYRLRRRSKILRAPPDAEGAPDKGEGIKKTSTEVEPSDSATLDETETAIKSLALGILRVARPYQKHEPLTIDQLHDFLYAEHETKLSSADFRKTLTSLFRRSRLPGLKRDGEDIYIEEEHYAWKTLLAVDEKAQIGRKAFSMIKSGDVIAIDAGSTSLEIAKCIAAGFRDQSLSQIVIVTNSYLVADAIVSTSMDLGLKDHDPMFRLYVVGGRVRLNTMAIVDDNTAIDEDVFHDFDRVLPALGGADIGFVGTNGIMKEKGFTTTDPGERRSKASLLKHSRRRVVVTDPSKFGLEQDQIFADFSDQIEILTTRQGDPRVLREYSRYISTTSCSMTFC